MDGSYEAVIQWLFDQLPNYQLQGGSAYKPGLDNIRNLLGSLGNPERNFRSIHIAGTNGKGSVAHALASVFIENGYKTGLFTSPHIKDFRERIKINGQMVDEEFVVDFVEKNRGSWDDLNPSFFEITAAMAFTAFSEEKCDIAIIETGLGGRLDATNVFVPELSVITNIGLEHTAYLGHTLAAIAGEKGGIIKPGVPVVIGEDHPETRPVFESIAEENNAELSYSKQGNFIETDLLGSFQQENMAIVERSIKVLKTKGWNLDDEKSRKALMRIGQNTGLHGRMELIGKSPDIILDAAHNLNGVQNLLAEIKNLRFKELRIVYGSSNDKDVTSIFKILPKGAKYYLTTFSSKRSLTKEELAHVAETNNLDFQLYPNPSQALLQAKANSSENDLILVFGSFYLMEEIF